MQRVWLLRDSVKAEQRVVTEVALHSSLRGDAPYPVPSLVSVDIAAVQVNVVLPE